MIARYAEQVASWPEDVQPCLAAGVKRTAARLEARVRQRLLRYAHRPSPRDASCPILPPATCCSMTATAFCSNYVQLMQLRKTIGPLDVLNMREHPELAVHFRAGP